MRGRASAWRCCPSSLLSRSASLWLAVIIAASCLQLARLQQNDSEATFTTVDTIPFSEAADMSLETEDTQELQSLLNWAIEHSDPSLLKEKAREANQGDERYRKRQLEQLQATMAAVASQKSEADLMKEAIEILEDPSTTSDHKDNALFELEDLVSQIDNANDFAKFGGVNTLLSAWKNWDPAIRASAFQVFGTAASNNVAFQESALKDNPELIQVFHDLILSESVDEVKTKAVYALATILRNSVPARNHFYKLNGPKLIVDILSAESSSPKLKKKALTLASDLQLLEKGYDIRSFSEKDFAEVLITLLKTGHELDMTEKSLMMIQLLVRTNPDTRGNFRDMGTVEAVDEFLKDITLKINNNSVPTGGKEYMRDLMSLGHSVLRDLRPESDQEEEEKEEL